MKIGEVIKILGDLSGIRDEEIDEKTKYTEIYFNIPNKKKKGEFIGRYEGGKIVLPAFKVDKEMKLYCIIEDRGNYYVAKLPYVKKKVEIDYDKVISQIEINIVYKILWKGREIDEFGETIERIKIKSKEDLEKAIEIAKKYNIPEEQVNKAIEKAKEDLEMDMLFQETEKLKEEIYKILSGIEPKVSFIWIPCECEVKEVEIGCGPAMYCDTEDACFSNYAKYIFWKHGSAPTDLEEGRYIGKCCTVTLGNESRFERKSILEVEGKYYVYNDDSLIGIKKGIEIDATAEESLKESLKGFVKYCNFIIHLEIIAKFMERLGIQVETLWKRMGGDPLADEMGDYILFEYDKENYKKILENKEKIIEFAKKIIP